METSLWSVLGVPALNIAILVFFLIRYGKAPLKKFVSERKKSFQVSLEEARTLLSQAERDFKIFSKKLEHLEEETKQLHEKMQAQAREQAEKMKAQAHEHAKKLVLESKTQVKILFEQTKHAIEKRFVIQVIDQAEKSLGQQLKDHHQEAFRKEFTSFVEKSA